MAELDRNQDLGQLLVEEGYISREQFQAAKRAQVAQEKSLGRVLVDMGLITDEAKLAFLHKRFDFEIVELSDVEVPTEILTSLARSFCEKHRCAPILVEDNQLVVAMEDPLDIQVLDAIQTETGMAVHPVIASMDDISRTLEQYPALSQKDVDAIVEEEPGVFSRVIHPLLFLFIMCAPMIVLFLGAWKVDAVGNVLMRAGSPFDIVLYSILGWALWAIVVWEIDGLLFGSSKKAEE